MSRTSSASLLVKKFNQTEKNYNRCVSLVEQENQTYILTISAIFKPEQYFSKVKIKCGVNSNWMWQTMTASKGKCGKINWLCTSLSKRTHVLYFQQFFRSKTE